MARQNLVTVDMDNHDYWCVDCGESEPEFYDLYELIEHCEIVHCDTWCGRCCFLFSSASALSDHLRDSSRHWLCDDCDLDCESRSEWVDHCLEDHDYCADCDCYFDDWNQHMIDDHHRCNVCGEDFDDENAVNMHRQTHGDRVKKCFNCDRHYKSFSGIMLHLEGGSCDGDVDLARIERFIKTNKPYLLDEEHHYDYRHWCHCHCCGKTFRLLSALCQHAWTTDCDLKKPTYFRELESIIRKAFKHGAY